MANHGATPTNQTGRPVKGADFYGRQDFLTDLWERIEEENNILLLAPRRVGKSSVMFKLHAEAKSRGFQPLMVSVAGVSSEAELFKEIIRALEKLNAAPAKKLLKDLVRRASWLRRAKKFSLLGSSLEIELNDNWKEAAWDLHEALARLPDQWLILIDELPIFVLRLISQTNSADRADVFLAWFRDLRQGPHAPKHIRWLLAGSIGLDTVTRQANLGDTINDLHKETRLGAFDAQISDAFLQELANRYKRSMEPGVRKIFLAKFTWLIPYHIQLLFSEVRDLVPQGQAVRDHDIDSAYEQLLAPRKRGEFDFWVQRLDKELPKPLNTLALQLVDAAASDQSGVTRSTLEQAMSTNYEDKEPTQHLDFLLQVLQTDGYLIADGDRYRFLSSLLQDFWKRSRLQ